MNCLLCRGKVTSSNGNRRYKNHLKFKHKVYFYTNWIIKKTKNKYDDVNNKYDNVKKKEKWQGELDKESIVKDFKGKAINIDLAVDSICEIKDLLVKAENTSNVNIPVISNEDDGNHNYEAESNGLQLAAIVNELTNEFNNPVIADDEIVDYEADDDGLQLYNPMDSGVTELSNILASTINELSSALTSTVNELSKNIRVIDSSINKTDNSKGEERNIINPILICEKSINETDLSKEEARNKVKSTLTFDKSINEQIDFTKEEESNIAKPTLICHEERGGGRHYGCSFCPQKKWKERSQGRYHVINGKYHDQTSAHDSAMDPNTPTVFISRGKDRKRKISCSACFKTFNWRSDASRHVKTAKIHTDAIQEQEIKIQNGPSVAKSAFSCRKCKEKFIKRDNLDKHRLICEGAFNKISKNLRIRKNVQLKDGLMKEQLKSTNIDVNSRSVIEDDDLIIKKEPKNVQLKDGLIMKQQLKSTNIDENSRSVIEDDDLIIKKEPENIQLEDGLIKVENLSNGLQLSDILAAIVNELSNSLPTTVNEFSNALIPKAEGGAVYQNSLSTGEDGAAKPTLLYHPQIAGGKTYSCSFCPQKLFSNKRRASKHVINAKYHDQNSDDQFGKDPEKATVLISRGEDDKRRISCSACFKTFTKRSSASNHVKYVKTHIRMMQDQGTNNGSADGIQFHEKEEEEERPFLLKETNSTDGKVLYRCNLCPKIIFVRKSRATRHLGRHMPVEKRKRFSCSDCKKKFVEEYSLIKHRSTKCKGLSSKKILGVGEMAQI